MNSSSSKDNGDLCKGGHGQEEISPSLDMDSCPTGVLIDFSFGNNVEPEPEISEVKEVLSAPSSDNVEYEDTFGLFEEVPPSSPPPLKEREGNQQTTPTLPPPNPKSRTKTVAKGRTHWTHSQPPPLIPPPTEEGEGGPNSSLNSTASPFGLGLGLERKKAKAKVKAVGNVKGVPQRSNSTPLSAAKSLEKRVVDPFSPLFNTSSSTSFTGEGKMGPKNNMETPIKRNKPQDPPTAELLVISGENKWSFSPLGEEQRQKLSQSKLEPQLENNSTPPKRPSVGAANLSDSDSLLDISNLSGFSCSDSEGLLEELVDKLKLPEDDIVQDGGARADYLELERATGVKNKSPSPEKATQDPLVANNNKKDDQDKITAMTAVVNANRRNCDKAEALVESTDYVVREKKRRDSVNSKLQRFSMLMSSQSSPIRSPPTSPKASSEEPEIRNYFPTPSTLAAACTPARRTQSFHAGTPRSSVSTMTSPAKHIRPNPDSPSTPTAPPPVAQQSAKKIPPPSPNQASFMTPARRPQSFHSWTPNRASLCRTTPSRSGVTPLIPKAQAQSVKKISLTFPTSPVAERSKSKENRPNILQPGGKKVPPASPAAVVAPGGTKNKENHTKPKIMPSALPRFGFGYKKK